MFFHAWPRNREPFLFTDYCCCWKVVHHFDPDIKYRSMDWRHSFSPRYHHMGEHFRSWIIATYEMWFDHINPATTRIHSPHDERSLIHPWKLGKPYLLAPSTLLAHFCYIRLRTRLLVLLATLPYYINREQNIKNWRCDMLSGAGFPLPDNGRPHMAVLAKYF